MLFILKIVITYCKSQHAIEVTFLNFENCCCHSIMFFDTFLSLLDLCIKACSNVCFVNLIIKVSINIVFQELINSLKHLFQLPFILFGRMFWNIDPDSQASM